MNKKKRIHSASVLKTLTFLFFMGLGAFGAYYELKHYNKMSFLFYLYTLGILLVSIPLHVLLHEIGHLLTGFLSGYDFIMFRLFNYLWIHTNQGFSKRKQYVPGILGQALMVPPKNSDPTDTPVIFYHLGGLFANGLTATLFIIFGRSISDPFIRYLFYLSAISALFLLVTNALPFKGTDGYNIIRYLKIGAKNDQTQMILHLYQDMVKGLPFKDLRERVDLKEFQDFSNPNTTTLYSIHAAAYLEELNFKQAHKIYTLLWQNIDLLFEGHKPEVMLNYFFTLLLTDPTHPDVEKISTSKMYQSYRKIKLVDTYRVLAADALYVENNFQKAQKILQKGKKEIQYAPTVSDEKLEEQLYDYLLNEINKRRI